MKKYTIKLGFFLIATLMMLASCTKLDFEDDSPIEVTNLVRSSPSNQPNHCTKIRLCIKNKTANTLYYSKITISITDESNDNVHEVYRQTLELGSKNNYNWTIGPYETQWSDRFATDFYIFGNAAYGARIDETLFY